MSLGNRIIDGKSFSLRTLRLTMISSISFFLFVGILTSFYKNQIFNLFSFNEVDEILLFVTLLYFLLISPTAMLQLIAVASGNANKVNISAAISSITLLILVGAAKFSSLFLNIEGIFAILLVSQLAGLIYIYLELRQIFRDNGMAIAKVRFRECFNLGAWIISILAPLSVQMDRYLVAKYGSVQQGLDINVINQLLLSAFPILSWVGSLFWSDARTNSNLSSLWNHLKIMLPVLTFFSLMIFFFLDEFIAFLLPSASLPSFQLQMIVILSIASYGIYVLFANYLSQQKGQLQLAFCSGVYFLLTLEFAPNWLHTKNIENYFAGVLFLKFVILLAPSVFFACRKIRESR